MGRTIIVHCLRSLLPRISTRFSPIPAPSPRRSPAASHPSTGSQASPRRSASARSHFAGRPHGQGGEGDQKGPGMGRLFLVSLAPTGTIYRCKHCDTPLAHAHHIVSRMFRAKHGKAYLFDKVVNVYDGESDDRMMTTGMHTVCDIFCVACGSVLGWKYLSAFDKDQRYKEGKFILDRFKINSAGPPNSTTQLLAEHEVRLSSSEDDDQGAA